MNEAPCLFTLPRRHAVSAHGALKPNTLLNVIMPFCENRCIVDIDAGRRRRLYRRWTIPCIMCSGNHNDEEAHVQAWDT